MKNCRVQFRCCKVWIFYKCIGANSWRLSCFLVAKWIVFYLCFLSAIICKTFSAQCQIKGKYGFVRRKGEAKANEQKKHQHYAIWRQMDFFAHASCSFLFLAKLKPKNKRFDESTVHRCSFDSIKINAFCETSISGAISLFFTRFQLHFSHKLK